MSRPPRDTSTGAPRKDSGPPRLPTGPRSSWCRNQRSIPPSVPRPSPSPLVPPTPSFLRRLPRLPPEPKGRRSLSVRSSRRSIFPSSSDSPSVRREGLAPGTHVHLTGDVDGNGTTGRSPGWGDVSSPRRRTGGASPVSSWRSRTGSEVGQPPRVPDVCVSDHLDWNGVGQWVVSDGEGWLEGRPTLEKSGTLGPERRVEGVGSTRDPSRVFLEHLHPQLVVHVGVRSEVSRSVVSLGPCPPWSCRWINPGTTDGSLWTSEGHGSWTVRVVGRETGRYGSRVGERRRAGVYGLTEDSGGFRGGSRTDSSGPRMGDPSKVSTLYW